MTIILLIAWKAHNFMHDSGFWVGIFFTVWLDVTILKGIL